MNEIFARRSTRRFLDRPVEPEKLERTQHTYAVMAETQNPFCVAHITA